jgi:hypothetical protein
VTRDEGFSVERLKKKIISADRRKIRRPPENPSPAGKSGGQVMSPPCEAAGERGAG